MLNQLRIFTLRRPLSRPIYLQSRSYVNSGSRTVHDGTSGSTNTSNQPNGEGKDFRPPWVYTASHILTYSLIPFVGLYCVFIADWGSREDHVFMPPRRWIARQKATFFSLSPAEQELARSEEDHEK